MPRMDTVWLLQVMDDTCLSPLECIRQNHCHCIEGAMLGAFVLSLHGAERWQSE